MCFRKGWMLFSSCLQYTSDPHNCSKISNISYCMFVSQRYAEVKKVRVSVLWPGKEASDFCRVMQEGSSTKEK